MPWSFKVNPKTKVVNKVKYLYTVYPYDVKVTGARLTVDRAKELELPPGTYFVDCKVKGRLIASAHHKDWRKAYGELLDACIKVHEAETAVKPA